MAIQSELKPTINEETLGGAGSTSFGSFKFAPQFVSGVSGTFTATGSYQLLSRVVVFRIILIGSITVGSGASVYSPIMPAKFPPGHSLAGTVQSRGMGNIEYSSAGPAVVFQRADGSWDISTAGSYSWIKLTGWYWTE